jgi:thiosulfate reductase cytochrome b subunit
MSGQLMRQILRWVHIVCALFLGTALYSPLQNNEAFMTLTLFGLVPIVAITGIMMWKQGKLMKFVNRNRELENTTQR